MRPNRLSLFVVPSRRPSVNAVSLQARPKSPAHAEGRYKNLGDSSVPRPSALESVSERLHYVPPNGRAQDTHVVREQNHVVAIAPHSIAPIEATSDCLGGT